MESLYDMQQRINDEVFAFVTDNMTFVGAAEVGLDPRCGYLYVSDEGIAVHKNSRSTLEYYGGFEYVPKEYVETIGGFTFYLADHDRVLDCVQYYQDMQTMKLDEVIAENDYMD